MRLLLPPSEAKSPGGRGRPLGDLGRAGAGSLAAARHELIEALSRLVAADAQGAALALLLPDGVAARALAANARVSTAPTAPALRRYCGVIYEGLNYRALSTQAQRIARRDTLIFSGLLGVVRGGENVPTYRVPAKAKLPGIGVVATHWRPLLDELVPPLLGSGLVVDLRSSDYRAMWRPRPHDAGRVVSIRVMSPLPKGGSGVVSYPSKFAKGRLAAALINRTAAGDRIRAAEDVAAVWERATGERCELSAPGELTLFTQAAVRL
jgi:cytoplasmic iron level regulating protein YaaA (DUF328/UPF0246 family)